MNLAPFDRGVSRLPANPFCNSSEETSAAVAVVIGVLRVMVAAMVDQLLFKGGEKVRGVKESGKSCDDI